MRIIHFSFFLMAIVCVARAAHANSCDTLLCMAGKLQGQGGGSECNQPVADYFNIVEYGKHWRFNPGATAAARLNFLNSCQAAGDSAWPGKINAVFGTVR